VPLVGQVYGTERVTLIQGDCLEVLPWLEAESIDAVIADPPYGTTACSWDSVIPLEAMWKELRRVLKPQGAVVFTASQPFTTTLIGSNREWYKYNWVWEKSRPSGHINAKNRPLKKHEDVCVFSSGTTANRSPRLMVYNPQGLVYSPYRFKRNATFSCKGNHYIGSRPSHKTEYDVEWKNYPGSIIKFSNPNNELTHPTQKPVALMEYLVRTYSNEGDTVLDFCMGSGTTGVAAIRADRNFVGVEVDPGYCAIAKERIAKAELAYTKQKET
jgi:site-specific DNA-methyltransferase (adenine-specific)